MPVLASATFVPISRALGLVWPFPLALGAPVAAKVVPLGCLWACARAPVGLRIEDVWNNPWVPHGSKLPRLVEAGSQQASSCQAENGGQLDQLYFWSM